MGRGPAGGDPAYIDLAQPAMVLARCSGIVRPRFLIRTLIQNQGTPAGQGRGRQDLALNLVEHCGSRPGRSGQEVLQGLAVVAGHVPRYVGKVPLAVHGQLPPQIIVSSPAGVARAGLETATKPMPEGVETFAQGAKRFSREAPAPRIMQRPRQAVQGLGGYVIRWPLAVIPIEPQQWHPLAAILQGQLVEPCPGRVLRTVSENSVSSQRLLGASAQAILPSRK